MRTPANVFRMISAQNHPLGDTQRWGIRWTIHQRGSRLDALCWRAESGSSAWANAFMVHNLGQICHWLLLTPLLYRGPRPVCACVCVRQKATRLQPGWLNKNWATLISQSVKVSQRQAAGSCVGTRKHNTNSLATDMLIDVVKENCDKEHQWKWKSDTNQCWGFDRFICQSFTHLLKT